VDTGMGLERTAAVLQGVPSNFLTDLVRPLIGRVEALSGRRYGAREADDVSMRVIADHARATSFLIADGVYPSNEWRGYVLRRILRRALRHGRLLGIQGPFLHGLVDTVVQLMGGPYPELVERQAIVTETIRQEEERFAETLDRGLEKIEEFIADYPEAERKVVPGRFLFTLYDTHGFPVDLAQEVLIERGFAVPEESLAEFDREMAEQRERARAGAAFGGEEEGLPVYQELARAIPSVDFLGYESLAAPARLLVMVADGRGVPEAAAGTEVEAILDRTPCYAESGGQVGDRGHLVAREGRGEIMDTYFRGPGLIVHRVRVTAGRLREGEEVAVSVEAPRREALRLNHTGTHLLHAALRRVLGRHVTQAGSLVAPDRLRFDFTHPSQVRDPEIQEIEDLVNEKVRETLVVDPFYTELDEALRIGALALFGEKYGRRVRVVRIADFSVELCGGTHLDHTGQIGLFKIVDEGAVAAGVRRVEALTGTSALRHVGHEEQALRETADLLSVPPREVPRRVARLLEEARALEKQLQALEGRLAHVRAAELVAKAREVSGVAVIAARLDGLDQEALRAVVDSIRERLGSGVICLGGVVDGKVALVSAVTRDLTGRFHAGRLIQEVARDVGGGGGGRPELAQAGGKDPAGLDQALRGVYDWVARQAGG